jgi:hypothetical protein
VNRRQKRIHHRDTENTEQRKTGEEAFRQDLQDEQEVFIPV